MGTSIDPIEYDVRELRALARVRGDRYIVDEFLWAELPDSFPPAEWSTEGDRSVAWMGSLDERQKPYLRELPDDPEGRRVAREWVEELVERTGSDATVEALAYYESLGWLTETVRDALEGYLLAVGHRPGGSMDDLTRATHVASLARTARLAQLAEPDDVPQSEADSVAESEARAEAASRSESEEGRGWVWGGSADGEQGWVWGESVGDEPGRVSGESTEEDCWMWGEPTGEDRTALLDRGEDRDTATATDADDTDSPPDEPSETDASPEDDTTVSGFEFGPQTD